MARFRTRLLLLLLLTALLSGCAGALRWSPDTYVVQEGDTLYSIAFRHGVDYRALARWNDIGDGYLIFPGDELVLSEPPSERARSRATSGGSSGSRGSANEERRAERGDSGRKSSESSGTAPSSSSGKPVKWDWPLKGEVLHGFGEGDMKKGIQIGADEGTPVLAAADGRVVYTGSGLIGYGKLIIIKHDEVYLSAYGHNQSILVSEGDTVEAGDRIARVGLGRGNRPMLHFEIRSEGRAVDPADFLP